MSCGASQQWQRKLQFIIALGECGALQRNGATEKVGAKWPTTNAKKLQHAWLPQNIAICSPKFSNSP